jgi:hypothetical protein
MKIDPQTYDLFTDSGHHLKTLHCPLRKRWKDMSLVGGQARLCDSCARTVYDTAGLNDPEIQNLLHREPESCLAISITQDNYTILPRSMQNRLRLQRDTAEHPPNG